MIEAVQWIGIIFSGLAAVLWFRSALITVPDNIDTMIGVMQRVGYWNAAAAACACIAFASQTYLLAAK